MIISYAGFAAVILAEANDPKQVFGASDDTPPGQYYPDPNIEVGAAVIL